MDTSCRQFDIQSSDGKASAANRDIFRTRHILQLSHVRGYEISLPLWNSGNARYDISFYPCFAGLRGFPHRFNPQFPFCNVHVVSVGYRKHFHVGLHVPRNKHAAVAEGSFGLLSPQTLFSNLCVQGVKRLSGVLLPRPHSLPASFHHLLSPQSLESLG